MDIVLKKDRDQSVRRFHPWIFSGAIETINGKPVEGDLVTVRSNKGEFLGRGFFGDRSIAVKVVTFQDEALDSRFFVKRFAAAFEYRKSLGLFDNPACNAFRFIHGEGDGCPGLIIDLFGDAAVVELHSAGYEKLLPNIREALQQTLGSRCKCATVQPVSHGAQPTLLFGTAPENGFFSVLENNINLSVPFSGGQKTGYFLDQRENRNTVQHYAHGRTVLDCFSYSGGFSLNAARGGAKRVVAVDASAAALELVERNAKANEVSIEGVKADCLEYLKDIPERFDLIVLDPPAFVKHRGALSGGMKGYQSINASALRQIAPGGLLFTFSCSQLVSPEDFRSAVLSAAIRVGRTVRVASEFGQAPCHPTNLYHPEGRYLKGLMLYVE